MVVEYIKEKCKDHKIILEQESEGTYSIDFIEYGLVFGIKEQVVDKQLDAILAVIRVFKRKGKISE